MNCKLHQDDAIVISHGQKHVLSCARSMSGPAANVNVPKDIEQLPAELECPACAFGATFCPSQEVCMRVHVLRDRSEDCSRRFSACSRALPTSLDVDEGVCLPKKMLNLCVCIIRRCPSSVFEWWSSSTTHSPHGESAGQRCVASAPVTTSAQCRPL